MKTCPNCNKVFDADVRFCDVCGAPMEDMTAKVPETPAWAAQPQPVWQEPARPVQPVAQPARPVYDATPAPSKGKQIVGMVLGIAGFGSSIGGAVIALLSIMLGAVGVDELVIAYAGMGIAYSMVGLALSVVGMILSSKCISTGKAMKLSNIGKKLGLVGIILGGVGVFFSIIGFAVGL